jgi:hypothetical protein
MPKVTYYECDNPECKTVEPVEPNGWPYGWAVVDLHFNGSGPTLKPKLVVCSVACIQQAAIARIEEMEREGKL